MRLQRDAPNHIQINFGMVYRSEICSFRLKVTDGLIL